MVSAKVLIIESETEIGMQAARPLTDLGHQVRIATTQKEGLDWSLEDTFDVVLCDLDAPQIDGIDLIQRIRAQDPTLVLVAMTARTDQKTAVRALEAGARSFLPKPFSDEDLKLRVQKALRERKRLVDTQLLLGDLIHTRSDLQQKVAEREHYLQHLIDAAPFAILSTDRDGRVLTYNGKAEQMYGYRPPEAVGKPISMLFGKQVNDSPESKARHVRKDGGPFPVLVYRRDILEGRHRIAHLYVVEDRSEREHMEEQLLYAERLSLLGQMAPRIAHEFKTPLQVIIGSAQIAQALFNRGDCTDLSEWLERIPEAADQILDLIHQMFNMSKPVENKQEEIDLQAELAKLIDTLTPLGVLKYCKIVQDIQDPLPTIMGDPAQIEQVFRNLIVNAAHAMEESPSTSILTLGLSASPDRKRLECRVSDTGSGISPENLDQIFQPFFTTKPEGKGTGLGLPIVKTILDRHSGTIQVESQVGEGTCFIVTFPVCPQP